MWSILIMFQQFLQIYFDIPGIKRTKYYINWLNVLNNLFPTINTLAGNNHVYIEWNGMKADRHLNKQWIPKQAQNQYEYKLVERQRQSSRADQKNFLEFTVLKKLNPTWMKKALTGNKLFFCWLKACKIGN